MFAIERHYLLHKKKISIESCHSKINGVWFKLDHVWVCWVWEGISQGAASQICGPHKRDIKDLLPNGKLKSCLPAIPLFLALENEMDLPRTWDFMSILGNLVSRNNVLLVSPLFLFISL